MLEPQPTADLSSARISEEVARLWMGWSRTAGGWALPDGSPWHGPPRFAADARQASQALAQARRRGFHCTVRVLAARDYEVTLAGSGRQCSEHAPSLPLAICRALLSMAEALVGPRADALPD